MASTQSVRVVCACVAVIAAVADVSAQGRERQEPVEMSVDITVTHDVVDKDGNVVGPPQVATAFTVARTRRSGAWQTVLTYRAGPGSSSRASAHPLEGARVVFDEGTGETRFHNAAGELDPLLTGGHTKARGLAPEDGPASWLDGLVATPAARTARARDLHEAYGSPVGRVRALDRFVKGRDDVVEEVLADPDAALPLEMNSVRNGALESHIVFEYSRRADDTWVRRRMRAERRLPGEGGHRVRTAVEFTNVQIGGR